jgi:hypothetical protein
MLCLIVPAVLHPGLARLEAAGLSTVARQERSLFGCRLKTTNRVEVGGGLGDFPQCGAAAGFHHPKKSHVPAPAVVEGLHWGGRQAGTEPFVISDQTRANVGKEGRVVKFTSLPACQVLTLPVPSGKSSGHPSPLPPFWLVGRCHFGEIMMGARPFS